MTRDSVRRACISLLIGALGAGLLHVGWHLYIDHQNLHALVNFIQSQAAQPRPSQGPK